jgi:AraC-like DNA-binding protein
MLVSVETFARWREAAGRSVTLIQCSELDALDCVLSHRVSAIVVEPRLAVQALIDAVGAIHRARPSATIAIYCPLNPASARTIVSLVKAGAQEIILHGYDDPAVWLRRQLTEWRTSGVPTSMLDRVASVLPAHLAPFISYCFRHAHEAPTVSAAAQAVGVHRRTLVNWLRVAALPPPRLMISWCRLLSALERLVDSNESVEHVAHAMRFGSGAALRKMCLRYTGYTLTSLRSVGGLRTAVSQFLQGRSGFAGTDRGSIADSSREEHSRDSRSTDEYVARAVPAHSHSGIDAAERLHDSAPDSTTTKDRRIV